MKSVKNTVPTMEPRGTQLLTTNISDFSPVKHFDKVSLSNL